MFLVVHYSEVVVVTGAEHTIRHDLVIPLPALHDPEGPPARFETIIDDVSSVDERQRRWKPFFEDLGQSLFLFFG